jgi:hypothetical protein
MKSVAIHENTMRFASGLMAGKAFKSLLEDVGLSEQDAHADS